jgi:Domain of unknown function (DUF4282)
MSDYFSFQKYVTSYFVKVIYFIGFLAFTAAGLGLAIWSARRLQTGSLPTRLGWYYIAAGIGILFVGNLVWRVFCELWVVVFNMNDHLVSLDRKFGGETATEVTHDDALPERTHEVTASRRSEGLGRPAGVLGLSG